YPFENTQDNKNGANGRKIVAVPNLLGRRYTQLSIDETIVIGPFCVVLVTGMSVIALEYLLAEPPDGMAKRQQSDNLEFWESVEHPTYDFIDTHAMNTLAASLGGGPGEVGLRLTSGAERTTSGSAKLTIKQKTTIQKLFKIESSLGF